MIAHDGLISYVVLLRVRFIVAPKLTLRAVVFYTAVSSVREGRRGRLPYGWQAASPTWFAFL